MCHSYMNDETVKTTYLYSFGIACAAVFRTYGDISEAESLIANITMGTITGTRMLDRTRSALALISWFGS